MGVDDGEPGKREDAELVEASVLMTVPASTAEEAGRQTTTSTPACVRAAGVRSGLLRGQSARRALGHGL